MMEKPDPPDFRRTDPQTQAFHIYSFREAQAAMFFFYINVLGASVETFRKFLPREDRVMARKLEGLITDMNEMGDPDFFRRQWTEFAVVHSVDSFQTFLADVLQHVFKARPETLKSSDKVEVREVLDSGSIDDFVARMAARKAEELSYEGFLRISQYLTNQLGIAVNWDAARLQEAKVAIAVRNIIVHNRRHVNQRFLRETGRQDLRVGTEYPLSPEEATSIQGGLLQTARDIDRSLIGKFGAEQLGATIEPNS